LPNVKKTKKKTKKKPKQTQQSVLLSVDRSQFFNQMWSKHSDNAKSLVVYIQLFNQISHWVATSIVRGKNKETNIQIWIKKK
jgi:hypothetical protein